MTDPEKVPNTHDDQIDGGGDVVGAPVPPIDLAKGDVKNDALSSDRKATDGGVQSGRDKSQTDAPGSETVEAPYADTVVTGLHEASLEYWSELGEDHRIECYKAMEVYFHDLLEELRRSGNEAVADSSRYGSLGKRWRLALIFLTGGLAVLNVLATAWPAQWAWLIPKDLFSFFAAVYAVILALLTNIESFHNYQDKRVNTRESRELFVDAYREFQMLRLNYVYPFGHTPQACYNFGQLYRRLVLKDAELRRKIMQISVINTNTGAKQK